MIIISHLPSAPQQQHQQHPKEAQKMAVNHLS